VTFLPMLDGNCTFNVLVYADADSEVPLEWGDSDAKEIKNGEKVQLRSFSTSNHRVDTLVSYRWAAQHLCFVEVLTHLDLRTDLLLSIHTGVLDRCLPRLRSSGIRDMGQAYWVPEFTRRYLKAKMA
jgi:hypothetical protein